MKHTMIKAISLIMVFILLLGAFAGCGDAMDGNKETTPSVNAGQTPKEPDNKEEEQDDPTRVFTIGDLEPLSKEKQAEVEAVWNTTMTKKLSWTPVEPPYRNSHRYYGIYSGCVVIFESITSVAEGSTFDGGIYVGNQKIESWYLEKVWVYHNGEFVDIRVAYENKLLSDDDISAIVKYNREYEEYLRSR